MYVPAHKILVFLAYQQIPVKHAHDVMSSRVRGLMFDPVLILHPNFVNVSGKGSAESAHMCRLTYSFVAIRPELFITIFEPSYCNFPESRKKKLISNFFFYFIR